MRRENVRHATLLFCARVADLCKGMAQKNEENVMMTRQIGIAALAALVMVAGCGKKKVQMMSERRTRDLRTKR